MRIIFIDNGCTGSIGVYDNGMAQFFGLTPTVSQLDYTKERRNVTRINVPLLHKLLGVYKDGTPTLVVLEHPMVNPNLWNASVSAVRALEATLTVLETLELPYKFCDSKEWQKGLLPSSGKRCTAPGMTASEKTAARRKHKEMLKQESKDIGCRLFPQYKDIIEKHKDADGILGAYQFWKKENVG